MEDPPVRFRLICDLRFSAQSPIHLGSVRFTDESGVRLSAPRLGTPQMLEAYVAGEISDVRFHIVDATGGPLAGTSIPPKRRTGARTEWPLLPKVERFRILISGTDKLGRPVQ